MHRQKTSAPPSSPIARAEPRPSREATTRWLPILTALLLLPAVLVRPAAAVATPCFGQAATIADHHGEIVGTSGSDVIIGDKGKNVIHTGGGDTDLLRFCS